MSFLPSLPAIDPADILPYSADFSGLLDPGDVISSASVTANASLTISPALISGAVISAFVSNATANASYALSFEVTTAAGWQVKRSGIIVCRSR